MLFYFCLKQGNIIFLYATQSLFLFYYILLFPHTNYHLSPLAHTHTHSHSPTLSDTLFLTHTLSLSLSLPHSHRHAQATSDIFRSIMNGHDEVNVQKSVSVGMENNGKIIFILLSCYTDTQIDFHSSALMRTFCCCLSIESLLMSCTQCAQWSASGHGIAYFPPSFFIYKICPHQDKKCVLIFFIFYPLLKSILGALNRSNNDNNDENENETDLKATALQMLLALPCVNSHNFRNIMDNVDSIAELSKLTEIELIPLVGPGNAKKLFYFFRRRQ